MQPLPIGHRSRPFNLLPLFSPLATLATWRALDNLNSLETINSGGASEREELLQPSRESPMETLHSSNNNSSERLASCRLESDADAICAPKPPADNGRPAGCNLPPSARGSGAKQMALNQWASINRSPPAGSPRGGRLSPLGRNCAARSRACPPDCPAG